MDAPSPESPRTHPRTSRDCGVCGLAVGSYEPAVFVFAEEIIHSSRAAQPELVQRPGVRLLHSDCFDAHGPGPHLRAVPS